MYHSFVFFSQNIWLKVQLVNLLVPQLKLKHLFAYSFLKPCTIIVFQVKHFEALCKDSSVLLTGIIQVTCP